MNIFIFIFLFFSTLQLSYTFFILSLTSKEINYQPHHEDGSGGQQVLIKPVLSFFYAMFTFLVISVVFIIYDHVILKIEESNRISEFVFYVLIAAPGLFLPVFHLHRLMVLNRDIDLLYIRKRVHNLYTKIFDKKKKKKKNNVNKEIKTFEYIEKYYSLYDQYPTWPLPRIAMSFPIATLMGAIFNILKELYL